MALRDEVSHRRRRGDRIYPQHRSNGGKCADVCPYDAYKLFGEYKTCDQLLERVLRDRPFYRKSGGGVTASGGEPTLQLDFLIRFFHALKREGIHTALETHGYFPTEKLASLAECTDTFLFDIKHMDSSVHKRHTGVPNELILQNIRELAVVHRANVVMRVPLIPGFNDDDDNLKTTASLARRLSREGTLKGVHLLKFHNMALSKYAALDREYAYEITAPYPAERFDHVVSTFRSEYPDAVVGG